MKTIIRKLKNFFFKSSSKKLLPDPYTGELNTQRIKAYKSLGKEYNLEESIIREIFCKGVDWYKKQCEEDYRK